MASKKFFPPLVFSTNHRTIVSTYIMWRCILFTSTSSVIRVGPATAPEPGIVADMEVGAEEDEELSEDFGTPLIAELGITRV